MRSSLLNTTTMLFSNQDTGAVPPKTKGKRGNLPTPAQVKQIADKAEGKTTPTNGNGPASDYLKEAQADAKKLSEDTISFTLGYADNVARTRVAALQCAVKLSRDMGGWSEVALHPYPATLEGSDNDQDYPVTVDAKGKIQNGARFKITSGPDKGKVFDKYVLMFDATATGKALRDDMLALNATNIEHDETNKFHSMAREQRKRLAKTYEQRHKRALECFKNGFRLAHAFHNLDKHWPNLAWEIVFDYDKDNNPTDQVTSCEKPIKIGDKNKAYDEFSITEVLKMRMHHPVIKQNEKGEPVNSGDIKQLIRTTPAPEAKTPGGTQTGGGKDAEGDGITLKPNARQAFAMLCALAWFFDDKVDGVSVRRAEISKILNDVGRDDNVSAFSTFINVHLTEWFNNQFANRAERIQKAKSA